MATDMSTALDTAAIDDLELAALTAENTGSFDDRLRAIFKRCEQAGYPVPPEESPEDWPALSAATEPERRPGHGAAA